jgi:HKD family nuclease
MIIYENEINKTKEEFKNELEKFKNENQKYIDDVMKGLNPNGEPYATIRPRSSELIEKIVFEKIEFEFKTNEEIQEEIEKSKEEEEQKQAEEQKKEAEKQQKEAEAEQKKSEELSKNKLDINHIEYDYIYARTQAYGTPESQLEFITENGLEQFKKRQNEIKNKYPKKVNDNE